MHLKSIFVNAMFFLALGGLASAFPAMLDTLDKSTRDFITERMAAPEPVVENIVERQTTILPPVVIPPVLIPGLPSLVQLTIPGVITVGRKIIPDAAHPFRAPGPTDQRGGCAGLNIMANYGYIDRSGVTTAGELLYGLQEMLGLSWDLAAALVVLSLRGATDPTTLKLSIGLTDTRTNGPFSFLFGQAPGLFSAKSHNKLEIDGSMAFTDNQFVPDHTGNRFNSSLWATNVAFAQANGGIYDINFNAPVRYNSYKQCVATNPECTWLAVSQLLFYGAEGLTFMTFPSTGPDGNLEAPTTDVVFPFMGIQDNGDGTYTKIPEKLPPGSTGPWYRRSRPLLLADVANTIIASWGRFPVAFGANSNGINTFVVSGPQLDETNLTTKSVSCLLIALLIEETPNALGALANALLATTKTDLGC